jgi:addiction module HigA family antidote
MKNPPHPGDFIRTELLAPAGLSVTAASVALRVSRPALSSLLNGKASLSGDMALRIEKAFGVKMDTLMRMQASYDIAQTRKPKVAPPATHPGVIQYSGRIAAGNRSQNLRAGIKVIDSGVRP